MKSFIFAAAVLLTMVAQALLSAGDAKDKKDAKSPSVKKLPGDGESQDLIYLAESRPILVRVHARINGKSVQAGWDSFVDQLFRYIDANNDGFLSQTELDRAPTMEQILAGGPSPSVFGGYSSTKGAPGLSHAVNEMDTNKDGKVDLAEYSAHVRKSFAPFQLDSEPERNLNEIYFFGPSKIEPTIDAVSDAAFALLDADKDGKISRDELAAAPQVLLKLDTNEDEILTTREIVPNARPNLGRNEMMAMMGPNNGKASRDASSSMIVLIPSRGLAPADLPTRLQERYSVRTKGGGTQLGEMIDWGLKSAGLDKKETAESKAKAVLLSRSDLGLDQPTFAALDTNGDGKLDAKELAGFVQRTPDVELVIRLGTRTAAQNRLQVQADKGKQSALAGKIKAQSDLAFVDLGATRAEFRCKDGGTSDRLSGIIRQQYTQLYKQAEKGKGYIDEKDAQNFFRDSFKAMDRDGDGKVTDQEFYAYLDLLADLQKQANLACVSVVISNESRGLFDLMDLNRDGKLGVREMREAVKLTDSLAPAGKGYITRSDIPRTFRLTLRSGPAGGGDRRTAQLAAIYGGGDEAEEQETAAAGPPWFRKMDRNRDGDLSRNEWLGSHELFRQIDTDGDGLISVQEAERYDAEQRLRK